MIFNIITHTQLNIDIFVVGDCTYKQMIRKLKKALNLDESWDKACERDTGGLTIQFTANKKGTRRKYLVWVRNPKKMNVIVHEAFHLASYIWEHEAKKKIKNEEDFAYYLEDTFTTLTESLLGISYRHRIGKRKVRTI